MPSFVFKQRFSKTLFITGQFSLCLIIYSYSALYSPAIYAFEYFQPLPTQALIAADNPQTAEKIQLGKTLFYDKRLSSNRTYSCNTCHNLLTGGDDDRAHSIGIDGTATKRSAPGLWNIGLQTVLYWDGRVDTLEQQARDHLLDKQIMGNTDADALIQRLAKNSNYQKRFAEVFGNKDALTFNNLTKALASFQRALLAPNSPFDRYLDGDEDAVSELAKRGQKIFHEVGCSACHFGVNYAGPAPGPALNKMGDGFYELFPTAAGSKYDSLLDLMSDTGRFGFTGIDREHYMWRVPSLRNIALTAPYFHNGSAKTLRLAVLAMGKAQYNTDLTEDQVDAIVAFLNSLTGELPKVLRTKQASQ